MPGKWIFCIVFKTLLAARKALLLAESLPHNRLARQHRRKILSSYPREMREMRKIFLPYAVMQQLGSVAEELASSIIL